MAELPLSVHRQQNKTIVHEMAPRNDRNKTTNAHVVTLRTYWVALEDLEENCQHPAGHIFVIDKHKQILSMPQAGRKQTRLDTTGN